MIRLLTAIFLFASFNAVADTEVPHTFQDGEVIDAQKFNEDFDALEAAIDANAAALPPTNCTTDQIIKWDDTNDAWVCATDPFAGLNCDVGDQLIMGSSGWECAGLITASLMQSSWQYEGHPAGGLHPIDAMFESLNNVDTFSSGCDGHWCYIEVIGVADHTSCVAQFTGGAVGGWARAGIFTNPSEIEIVDISTWNEAEAVYINISCTP